MENRRGAGFEIRQSVLWLVSDGVGEEDVDVLLAIVRARLAAKKSRSSFAKEKVRNFIRIEISLKSSLLGGWAIEPCELNKSDIGPGALWIASGAFGSGYGVGIG